MYGKKRIPLLKHFATALRSQSAPDHAMHLWTQNWRGLQEKLDVVKGHQGE
jgi:hypothetical protein